MDIQVSIICNTYNHEAFIAKAIEGFVMQKTTFSYEVLIHDDASTDRTPEIIRSYEEKYPEIIKPILQTDNMYSKGVNITAEFQMPRAKGEYIAFCEGDDYWTDEYKLQKQWEILESYSSIDICAHKAEEIDGVTWEHRKWVAPADQNKILKTSEVIKGGGAYVATASLFYRKKIVINPPSFRKMYAFDYTLQVSGALRGGMYYINESMSVYRFMTPGSWTKTMKNNIDKKIEHKVLMKSVLKEMDKDTNRVYHPIIRKMLISNKIKTIILKAEKMLLYK